MPAFSDAPAQLYWLGWYTLFAVMAFYVVAAIALRWQPFRIPDVALYKPPEELSPSIAAFLWERGRYERAFAAALISLAAKGYVRILQKADCFTILKLQRDVESLPPEEVEVLDRLFPDAFPEYSFDNRDSGRLFAAYRHFRRIVHGFVVPQYASTHIVIWLCGFIYSLTALEPIVFATPNFGKGMSLPSIGFLIVVIIVGGSCFVAALRAWPITLRKIASLLPGTRGPRRPLNGNDATPILLTGPALLAFAFLAILTSTRFACLAAAVVAINVLARRLLNAPTRAGRQVLNELRGFREFLSRADSDRFSRENQPGRTPDTIEQYTAYAVALGVERGWGEELAGDVSEMLQMDEAYDRPATLPLPDDSPKVLTLFDRKR